jgi:predicted nucleic acid-binding protein
MGSTTYLTDHNDVAVIDTSVVINLIATGSAEQIINALPNSIAVVNIAANELEQGRLSGRPTSHQLSQLVSTNTVELVTLDSQSEMFFERLVIGPAIDTLDDGEAATIAHAVHCGGIAVIDERKATRICATQFEQLSVISTVDLLAHPDVLKSIGSEKLTHAVLNALRLAHMRVPPHYFDWVVDLVGRDEAENCTSLPLSVRARKSTKLN